MMEAITPAFVAIPPSIIYFLLSYIKVSGIRFFKNFCSSIFDLRACSHPQVMDIKLFCVKRRTRRYMALDGIVANARVITHESSKRTET